MTQSLAGLCSGCSAPPMEGGLSKTQLAQGLCPTLGATQDPQHSWAATEDSSLQMGDLRGSSGVMLGMKAPVLPYPTSSWVICN